MIVSFIRPETDTYYKHAHSFLENFSTEQGYLRRKVYFGNQWYRSKSGEWIAGAKSSFSQDATARKGVRLDKEVMTNTRTSFSYKTAVSLVTQHFLARHSF